MAHEVVEVYMVVMEVSSVMSGDQRERLGKKKVGENPRKKADFEVVKIYEVLGRTSEMLSKQRVHVRREFGSCEDVDHIVDVVLYDGAIGGVWREELFVREGVMNEVKENVIAEGIEKSS
ncbi:hypothetical protein Tco_0969298 [Tanacetum coccineum]